MFWLLIRMLMNKGGMDGWMRALLLHNLFYPLTDFTWRRGYFAQVGVSKSKRKGDFACLSLQWQVIKKQKGKAIATSRFSVRVTPEDNGISRGREGPM